MEEKEKSIGKNIRKHMEEHGLNAAELAKRLDVSPSTVYFWLNGSKVPRMDKIDRMCSIFGCARTDIISDALASPVHIEQEVTDTDRQPFEDALVLLTAYRELTPAKRRLLMAYLGALTGGDD